MSGVPAYDGEDMASYLMSSGWKMLDRYGSIKSITNIHDTAIIVTEYAVFRAKPDYRSGFCVELVSIL